MGVEIKIDIDQGEVRRLLHSIVARGHALPMKRVAVIGIRSVLRNFRDEGRPTKWKPLKYPEGHRRFGGMILQDTGALKKSVNQQILGKTNLRVFAGTGLPYAATHQYGLPSRSIPARPFMMWQQEDVRDVEKLLAEHIVGIGKGHGGHGGGGFGLGGGGGHHH